MKEKDNVSDSISGCAYKEAENEACYYEMLAENRVRCQLCFRECLIEEGSRGFCRTRENRSGKLICANYNRPAVINTDPVEKEPLYHFKPGSGMISVGCIGCNFHCSFCHNWHLSQKDPVRVQEVTRIRPGDLVDKVREEGLEIISFTYNEPIINYEYLIDTAGLAKKENIKTIVHTNGAIKKPPLRQLLKYIDGLVVDFKGFTGEAYSDYARGKLKPVQETVRNVIEAEDEVWTEIIYLVMPEINDSLKEVKDMAAWLVENAGQEVPLHLNRAMPAYQQENMEPVSADRLEKMRKTALDKGLNYVYIGNVSGHDANSTFCPGCDKLLISRRQHQVFEKRLADGNCPECGRAIAGCW